MILKLFRNAASLSLATLLVGTALPSLAQAQTASQSAAASTDDQDEDAVSPNPADDPQFILSNLTEVSPLNLAYVVADEWKAGNKLQASFWFYIWQIRTDAWVTGVDESGFKIYRNMLNDEMGRTINAWIAADPALMRDTAQRAIGYEAKLPLATMRPDEMSEADWLAIIAKSRSDYAKEMHDAFNGISDEEILETRAENGLAIGPLTDKGEPLPEDWR